MNLKDRIMFIFRQGRCRGCNYQMSQDANTRLMVQIRSSLRLTRNLFHWGMLAVGLYVMLSAGIVLKYGSLLTPLWRYILTAGLVIAFVALWTVMSRLFDRINSR